MDINLNDLLKSLGIKDSFDTRAKEALEKEKGNVDDTSIFDSQQSFVSHYSEQIFGDKDEVDFQDFGDNLVKSGYVENDEIVGLQALVDNNADNKLSKDEAENLLSTVYANAAPEPEAAKTQTAEAQTQESDTAEELYDTVEVQPWGTGEDDCLSRIIQKHVDGIQLYTDDYHQYVAETCKLNGIEDPNLFSNKEVKLPVMKKDDKGEILRDENGKIQFYSEEELKEMKKTGENNKPEPMSSEDAKPVIDGDGKVSGYSTQVFDENGNLEKELYFNSDKTFAGFTTYKYNDNGQIASKRNFNDKSELTDATTYNYHTEGRIYSEETRDKNNEIVSTKEYAYDENGRIANIITQDANGQVTGQEKTEYLDDGAVETTFLNENGEPTKVTVKRDTTIETKYYEENGEIKSQNISEYNENEQKVKETLLDKDGNNVNIYMYEYNEQGVKITEKIFDSENKLVKERKFDPTTGEEITDS